MSCCSRGSFYPCRGCGRSGGGGGGGACCFPEDHVLVVSKVIPAGADPTKWFTTIQDAVNAAQPLLATGDVSIYVAPGVYTESVAVGALSGIHLLGIDEWFGTAQAFGVVPAGGFPAAVSIVGNVTWVPAGSVNESFLMANIAVVDESGPPATGTVSINTSLKTGGIAQATILSPDVRTVLVTGNTIATTYVDFNGRAVTFVASPGADGLLDILIHKESDVSLFTANFGTVVNADGSKFGSVNLNDSASMTANGATIRNTATLGQVGPGGTQNSRLIGDGLTVGGSVFLSNQAFTDITGGRIGLDVGGSVFADASWTGGGGPPGTAGDAKFINCDINSVQNQAADPGAIGQIVLDGSKVGTVEVFGNGNVFQRGGEANLLYLLNGSTGNITAPGVVCENYVINEGTGQIIFDNGVAGAEIRNSNTGTIFARGAVTAVVTNDNTLGGPGFIDFTDGTLTTPGGVVAGPGPVLRSQTVASFAGPLTMATNGPTVIFAIPGAPYPDSAGVGLYQVRVQTVDTTGGAAWPPASVPAWLVTGQGPGTFSLLPRAVGGPLPPTMQCYVEIRPLGTSS